MLQLKIVTRSVRNMIQLFGFLWRADTSKSSISYAPFIFRQDWNIAKFWTKRYCLACESRNWENQEFIMDKEKILKYLYLFFLVSCFVSVQIAYHKLCEESILIPISIYRYLVWYFSLFATFYHHQSVWSEFYFQYWNQCECKFRIFMWIFGNNTVSFLWTKSRSSLINDFFNRSYKCHFSVIRWIWSDFAHADHCNCKLFHGFRNLWRD